MRNMKQYRPDIDGLRAFAVGMVLLFHAFPKTFQGGFIGVDIFFVISGYLITTILLKQDTRNLSYLASFYARRFRRLLPALILVMGATLIGGAAVLLPDEVALLGKHILAGSLFVSNILLWTEAGYFDASSEEKPLLHLWSLGIEEQFYLLWPLIFFAILKVRRGKIFFLLLLIISSFLANVIYTQTNSSMTFYLLPFRFWELLAGGLLAFRENEKGIGTSHWKSYAGSALILMGFLLINDTTPFPSYWALLPVVGTYFLISAGPDSWANSAILSRRFFIWIGLISYPLYLWHWPLFSIARIKLGELNFEFSIFLILLSTLLAWLTWSWIEKPIQTRLFRKVDQPHLENRYWLRAGFAALLLSTVVGKATEHGLFLSSANRELLSILTNYQKRYSREYREHRCYFESTAIDPSLLASECYTPRDDAQNIFIWGDSFAAHLFHGLSNTLSSTDYHIMQVTSCAPVTTAGSSERCTLINEFAYNEISKIKPHVIIASNWINIVDEPNFFPELDNLLTKLDEIGIKVTVVGQMPIWRESLLKVIQKQFIMKSITIPIRSEKGINPKVFEADEILAAHFSNRKYKNLKLIRPLHHLCEEGQCQIMVGDDIRSDIISFDVGHLTPNGSVHLANSVLLPLMATSTSSQDVHGKE